jgi:hypothetical protein
MMLMHLGGVMRRMIRDVIVGSAGGYAATLVMERASSALYERQDESSRRREEELRPEMPTATLVRKVGELGGHEVEDGRAEQLGTWMHYAFGAAGGALTIALRRRGWGPLRAGVAVGLGMWVVADEGANPVLDLTPPATEFPLVTHLRALAAHVVYGLAVGGFVALAAGRSRKRAR